MFGVFYLLQRLHLPGLVCGLITLAGVAITFFALFFWTDFHPPAFDVEVSDHATEYSFRDHALAVAFANHNQAFLQSQESG